MINVNMGVVVSRIQLKHNLLNKDLFRFKSAVIKETLLYEKEKVLNLSLKYKFHLYPAKLAKPPF